jgi:diguanylate cyclase (GGDEF)-like protein
MFFDFSTLLFGGGLVAGLGLHALVRKMPSSKLAQTTEPVSRDVVASEVMFRSLAEVVPIGIFTTDADGECVFVNPKYCEISGQCLQAAPGSGTCVFSDQGRCAAASSCGQTARGMGWRNAIHAEDLEAVDAKWADLLANGTPFSIEYRIQRPSAAPIWVYAQAQRQCAPQLSAGLYVCSLNDITTNKAAEYEIQQLAFFDTLTGLANRRLLMERIKQAVVASTRTGNFGALLYLDLDNFKQVNDTRGHAVGDLLLQQVSARLKGSVRDGDTVARLGGDEFLIVLEGLGKSQNEAGVLTEAVAEKILNNLNAPYVLAGVEHNNSPSVGLVLFGQDKLSADDLMKCADMAMYQAKASGRNTMRFYDPAMQALVASRAALENDLRHAVATGDFELHYQPQFDANRAITGVEAFVRWHCQERGWVSPAAFIPLAEDTGLIIPLGDWVMQTACQQLAAWGKHPLSAGLSLSVKVSGQQFRQADFVQQVLATLERTQADPKLLKLDLNESLLLADVEDIVKKTNALTEHGIGCSLADLGTGYSSLSHLKRLSLEQLRIDQSFVQGLLTEPNDAAVTRSIFALAQSLNIRVSAEGIETQEQHDALAAFGCQAFQGYLFGQPLPAAQFQKTLENHRAVET